MCPYITKRRIGRANRTTPADVKRHNDKYNKYYQNRQWKLLRDYYMRLHPLCEECLFNGRSVPSEHCHHRVPWSRGTTEEDKLKLLLDPGNLEAVCSECHHKLHHILNSEHE